MHSGCGGVVAPPTRRERRKGCSVGDGTRDGCVVVESELASQLFDEVGEVMRSEPKSQPLAVAEVIARRKDEAGSGAPQATRRVRKISWVTTYGMEGRVVLNFHGEV